MLIVNIARTFKSWFYFCITSWVHHWIFLCKLKLVFLFFEVLLIFSMFVFVKCAFVSSFGVSLPNFRHFLFVFNLVFFFMVLVTLFSCSTWHSFIVLIHVSNMFQMHKLYIKTMNLERPKITQLSFPNHVMQSLQLTIIPSLFFSCVLKHLKQDTFQGWITCNMC